ncbi:MAG TPA: hypothetical protein VGN37_31185 [Actinocatenispora sp.]
MARTADQTDAYVSDEELADRATAVLRLNDTGTWTTAAPALYPHQWSWDSAFIAIGWAHLDPRRAMTEQDRLFDAQWATGKIPHIVFNEAVPAGAYFPDAARWACDLSPDAPAGPPETSGLCQPPVHALAVHRIWRYAEASGDADLRADATAFVRRTYPRLVAWHRYLATARDPEGSGLVTIYHPWEGADNSPRWDEAMARLEIGDLPPYQRRDTQVVAEAGQRPSDEDYDRYLWLVELLKSCRYDEAEIYASHPFLIKDVFFSGVLAAANAALLDLCNVVGADQTERDTIAGWLAATRTGLAEARDAETGLCLDTDVRTGRPIRVRTFAGFAPLLAGDADRALLDRLDSADFLGHPGLRWPILPSTSPADPAFDRRNYWRGPTWPVVNWLLWRALLAAGETAAADRLRHACLDQIRASGHYEYFDPFSGAPLGSDDQSWTAAVVLDWLAATD